MDIFHSILSWLVIVFAAIGITWVAVLLVTNSHEDYTPKVVLTTLGLIALGSVVALGIYLVLREVSPDWPFLHGTDENGEPVDRLLNFAGLISLPVTYFLVRGFLAWRKEL